MTATRSTMRAGAALAAAVAALDWAGIAGELDAHGCAPTGALLAPEECAALAATLRARTRCFAAAS